MTSPHTVKRRMHVICVYLLVIASYLAIGGVVMHLLERDNEMGRIVESERDAEQFNLSQAEMAVLEEAGFCSFPKRDAPQFTVGGSIFFVLTVITTIGYGSFAPRTLWGRSFTILYATLGISVIGILLQNLCHVVVELFRSLAARRSGGSQTAQCEFRAATRKALASSKHRFTFEELKAILITSASVDPDSWSEDRHGRILNDLKLLYQDEDETFSLEAVVLALGRWHEIQQAIPDPITTRLLFIIFGSCGIWVFAWAGVFTHLEGWLYHDSVWFACVTLSTIGFGDYAPATPEGRLAAFVFIGFGIGMVASFIHAITALFENYRFWTLQRLYNRGVVSEKVLVAQGLKVCLHTEENLASINHGLGRSLPVSSAARRQVMRNYPEMPTFSARGSDEEEASTVKSFDSRTVDLKGGGETVSSNSNNGNGHAARPGGVRPANASVGAAPAAGAAAPGSASMTGLNRPLLRDALEKDGGAMTVLRPVPGGFVALSPPSQPQPPQEGLAARDAAADRTRHLASSQSLVSPARAAGTPPMNPARTPYEGVQTIRPYNGSAHRPSSPLTTRQQPLAPPSRPVIRTASGPSVRTPTAPRTPLAFPSAGHRPSAPLPLMNAIPSGSTAQLAVDPSCVGSFGSPRTPRAQGQSLGDRKLF